MGNTGSNEEQIRIRADTRVLIATNKNKTA